MRNLLLLILSAILLPCTGAWAQFKFSTPTAYTLNSDAIQATTYDLNRDNVPDIIVAGGGAHKAAVLLSNANGTFNAAQYYATSDFCGGVAIGNANCDQYPDLWLSDYGNSSAGPGAVLVLPGQAGGVFGAPTSVPVSGNPQHVALGDFNGDRRTDFVALDKLSSTISVRLTTGSACTPAYGPIATYATASGGLSADFVRMVDLNRDGQQDALVVNQASSSAQGFSILLGNSAGTFGTATTYPTGAGYPADVAVSDLNGDNYPDVVAAFGDDKNLGVFFGRASAPMLGARVSYALPSRAVAVAIADYDDDAVDDVAAILASGDLVVLLGKAAGTFGAPITVAKLSGAANRLLAADFNQDFRPDLAVVGTGSVRILLNSAAPLPVQLVSFTARRASSSAVLDWATASELNNASFTVERSPDGQAWHTVATVAGHGTSTQAHRYTYTDQVSQAAYYRLAQRDVDGATTYSPAHYLAASLPGLPLLYPNPSAGSFSIEEAAREVRVHDALGRAVPVTLLPAGQVRLGQPQPGLYLVEWIGGDGLPQRAKVVVR